MSGDKALDFDAFHTQLNRSESGAVVAQVERAITHKSDWFAEPGASRSDESEATGGVAPLDRDVLDCAEQMLLGQLENACRCFFDNS